MTDDPQIDQAHIRWRIVEVDDDPEVRFVLWRLKHSVTGAPLSGFGDPAVTTKTLAAMHQLLREVGQAANEPAVPDNDLIQGFGFYLACVRGDVPRSPDTKMDNDLERNRRDLDRAMADIAVLKRGDLPVGTDLNALPKLENWGYAYGHPVPLLVGIVSGHPEIRDGRAIQTSPLLWLDERRRLARTRSRLYRLGASLSDLLNVTEDRNA